MIRNLFGGATKCRTIDKLDIFGDGSCKALYRLDGNANDESGNYHGTETAITYGGGVYERGAVFNGTSSYINTGYTFPYTAFSYSLWYKYGSVNKMIISSISTNPVKAGQFSLTQDSATQLDLEFVNNDSGTQTTLLNQTVPNMNDGLFHHIVIAIESGGFMKFYFDGALINTSSAVPAFVNSNTTALNLMREPRNNYYKDGSLDQVRIFNRAITAQEVATLYAECEPTSIVDNINPFEDGSLKALYKFDGDATDATGVYDGTATNVTYASGKFGNCAVFNGSSSKIVVPVSFWNLPLGRSVSFWLKAPDVPSFVPISGTTSYSGYIQRITANNLTLFSATDASLGVLTGVLDNTWHFITIVETLTASYGYKDGVLIFTSSADAVSATTTMNIGCYSSGSLWFNGSIDQVRIFNKALTPLEVASLYNETTPMEEPMSVQVDPFKDGSGKALYRLEGNALDESGNYNGTATSVTYWSGRFGRCAVFNGSSSSIVPTTFKLNESGGVYTVSVWLKTTQASAPVLRQGISGDVSYEFGLDWTTGYPCVGSYIVGSDNVVRCDIAVNDGNWHHIVYVFIQGSAPVFYVDGVLRTNVTIYGNGTMITNATSATSISIGGSSYAYASATYLNGSLDQVRIFDKALTQPEVTALYNEI